MMYQAKKLYPKISYYILKASTQFNNPLLPKTITINKKLVQIF